MSHMDEILARSRMGGKFVERGRFSLSRDKAIEKIREFSLRHPEQYILEMMQGAIFAHATYVSVHIEQNETVLAWVGGPPLSESQLRRIFDYLFIRSTRSETRHLHQLAIGINAVLQRKPTEFRIESGDGTIAGTTRIDLQPSGDFAIGVPETPLAGSYIRMVFSRSWPSRFQHLLGIDTERAEIDLIQQRCAYTPVPILLNGQAPFGWKATRRIMMGPHGHFFDEGSRRGVFCIPKSKQDPNHFHIVVGGVVIQTLLIPELGVVPGSWLPLSGVICDDALRKTADQSDIVQDDAWEAMLHALQPIATQLIQAHLKKIKVPVPYRPPDLPESSLVDKGALPASVPAEMMQIAPRPSLAAKALKPLLESGPVFYVRPNDQPRVEGVSDPQDFPYPLVILSEPEAEAVAQRHQPYGLLRISSDADIAFIQRAFERDSQQVIYRCPFLGTNPRLQGRLEMVLLQSGPRTAWAATEAGSMPVAVCWQGKTIWCDHIALPFPHMHAYLYLAHDPGRLEPETASLLALSLMTCIRSQAWNLFYYLDTKSLTRREREWVTSLLSQHVQSHLSQQGGCLIMEPLLPLDWGNNSDALLDVPLIDSTEGPVSLRQLSEAQGTDRIYPVEDYDHNDALVTLEARLGFGHLEAPGHQRPILIFTGSIQGGQPRLHHQSEWPHGRAGTVLFWLSAQRGPCQPPEGWKRLPIKVAHIGCAMPATHHGNVDFRQWLPSLEQALATRMDPDPENAPQMGLCLQRIRAAIRMALLGLGALTGNLHIQAPRTLEEWQLFEAIAGKPAPLILDDPSPVWRSLSRPESEDWVAHISVHFPGVKGWLGLRLPYDGTGGLMLQSVDHLWSESLPDVTLPCHGRLHFDRPCERIDERTRQLIRQAQYRLYGKLLDRFSPERASRLLVDDHRYAIHYLAPRMLNEEPTSALPPRLISLSTQVLVYQEQDAWGTLQTWMTTPAELRPQLSIPLRAESSQTAILSANVEKGSELPDGHPALAEWVRRQVAKAMGLSLSGSGLLVEGFMPTVELRERGLWGPPHLVRLLPNKGLPAVMLIDAKASVVHDALRDRSYGKILLTLECCRVLAEHRKACGGRLELHAAHQFLMAQML